MKGFKQSHYNEKIVNKYATVSHFMFEVCICIQCFLFDLSVNVILHCAISGEIKSTLHYRVHSIFVQNPQFMVMSNLS